MTQEQDHQRETLDNGQNSKEKKRLINKLQQNWFLLMQELGVDKKVGQKWWIILKKHYTRDNRYYHNLEHIGYLIDLYNRYHACLKQPPLVLLSIWFHDVVYEATHKQNEERSREFFLEFAKEISLKQENMGLISSYILATKTHQVPFSQQYDNDLLFFLDFDLAILGSSSEHYKRYVQQIRLENKHLSSNEFRLQRIQILNKLLDMPLYKTPIFRKKYLQRARLNLAAELKELGGEHV
ncbi:HD domain-containing protein [Legionella clemsonensis]|uniref:Metal-dependent HD superfamily phosphohydrolase n=1 Tax=Legionella clemsonensis TaxID=1867846 RepID=A0A222P4C0_9GAMM|nr:hypothetical protein [Legionella clemsonensis]ASQ46700.1 hypothetical protein clem_10770 [Legionella clemsonensis]